VTSPIYQRPLEMLQTLVRMDTTNPPGNKILCIQYLNSLLQEAGLPTTILAKEPNRPNPIARLPGRGNAPGLVLQGHVDGVATTNQRWDHLCIIFAAWGGLKASAGQGVHVHLPF
jgi:acetylornithine deacetylase/succinyl-diaminopimelate desuccinylase-like protein